MNRVKTAILGQTSGLLIQPSQKEGGDLIIQILLAATMATCGAIIYGIRQDSGNTVGKIDPKNNGMQESGEEGAPS